MPTPPRMGPKVSGPTRPGFTPPRPGPAQQVEVEKFDPATLAAQAQVRQAPPAPVKSREQDLMENAERIDLRNVPTKAKKLDEDEPPPMAPPDPPKDLMETLVTDDLISRLEAKFGVQPEKYHDADLEARGQTVKVSFRLPVYDDYIWAMAVLERKILAQEDTSLLQTEAQRNNMLMHLVSCRVVHKIEGQWIWDIFKRAAEIKTVNPAWSGTSMEGVPDFVQGTMAMSVYELFRKRLHADLLFDLEKAVREADTAATAQKTQEEGGEDTSDPTSGT